MLKNKGKESRVVDGYRYYYENGKFIKKIKVRKTKTKGDE